MTNPRGGELTVLGWQGGALEPLIREAAEREGANGLLTVFTWSLDIAGLETLRGLADCPIRILAHCGASNKGVVAVAERANIELRFFKKDRPCHAKGLVFRHTERALVGSFNVVANSFSKEGGASNIEFVAEVRASDVSKLAQLFDELWRHGSDELSDQDLSAQPHPAEPPRPEPPGAQPPVAPVHLSNRVLQEKQTALPYQQQLISGIYAWARHKIHGEYEREGRLLTLPTGAGKTLIAAEVVRHLLDDDSSLRILWVSHRKELLFQAMRCVAGQIGEPRQGFYHHYEARQLRQLKEGTGETIVDISALADRPEDATIAFSTDASVYMMGGAWDFVVVDEAHRYHGRAQAYRDLDKSLNRKHRAARLGLTATPLRGDDRAFGRYWSLEDSFGGEVTIESLEAEGYRARIDARSKPWDTGYRFTLGDSSIVAEKIESEILRRVGEFDNDDVNQAAVRALKEYRGQCSRILVFAVTIDHADRLTRMFGDDARALHSRQADNENWEALRWFRSLPDEHPETRVLVSVLMASEGVDLPKVDCLFLVRPTFSKVLHQQMIGRGLRGEAVGGTKTCVLVDFVHIFVGRGGELVQELFDDERREGRRAEDVAEDEDFVEADQSEDGDRDNEDDEEREIAEEEERERQAAAVLLGPASDAMRTAMQGRRITTTGLEHFTYEGPLRDALAQRLGIQSKTIGSYTRDRRGLLQARIRELGIEPQYFLAVDIVSNKREG